MCVVDDTVEDGVGECGFADGVLIRLRRLADLDGDGSLVTHAFHPLKGCEYTVTAVIALGGDDERVISRLIKWLFPALTPR